jgi:anti-sigma factor RsiW
MSAPQSDFLRQLIPLYINGALGESTRTLLEEQLQQDVGLRREYEEFLEIDMAFRNMERRAGADLDAALKVVLARVRQQPLRRSPRFQDGLRELARRVSELTGTRRFAWSLVAAQFVALAVIAVYLPERAGEQTLSTLSEETTAVEPLRVHVVFEKHATQEQVRALLQSVGARISDGPTEVGMVTLELRSTDADAAAAIGKLRAADIVVFAEPAY